MVHYGTSGLSIAFEVDELRGRSKEFRNFDLDMSMVAFQDGLWSIFFTPAGFPSKIEGHGKCAVIKLGPGIAAAIGLNWDRKGETEEELPERAYVLLV